MDTPHIPRTNTVATKPYTTDFTRFNLNKYVLVNHKNLLVTYNKAVN